MATATASNHVHVDKSGAAWIDDTNVKVQDATSGQETLTLKYSSDARRGKVFSADGKRLMGATRDKGIQIWDAQPRSEEKTPEAKTR